MDKLGAMQAFTKIVALGSYAEAGRYIGLTRSTFSKGVMELEQILGARLLDRTTREVSPTEAVLPTMSVASKSSPRSRKRNCRCHACTMNPVVF